MNLLRRIRSTIFLKLLLISILAGVLTNVIVFRFIHNHSMSSGRSRDQLKNNLNQYASYVAQDLGTPPDLAKAKAFSQRLNIRMRIEGPSAWASDESLPTFKDLTPSLKFDPNFQTWMKGPGNGSPPALVIEKGATRLLFFAPDGPGLSPALTDLTNLMSLLMLVTLASYLVLRRTLQPLKKLEVGVSEIGKGNLDFRVSNGANDEMGRLAVSFNRMAGRIKEMVQGKEQLLLDVSHELRSPLTRMKVFLEFVKEAGPKEQISAEIKEMDQMLEEILETARLQSSYGEMHREAIELRQLLQTILAKYDSHSHKINFSHPPQPIPISADLRRLTTVFKNLLENAMKYSPAGSPVEVSVSVGNAEAIVRIKDNGIGIAVDELARVFEPFYRVDKSRSRETGGFGLGLSLCQKIIEAHGGRISLSSRENQGTTVNLFLPLA